MPAGLTLTDNGDRTASLRGVATTTGTSTMRVMVADPLGSAVGTVTVHVLDRHVLPAFRGLSGTYTASLPWSASDAITVVDGALPPGLSPDPITATLQGAVSVPGHYEFTLRREAGGQVDHLPVAFDHFAPPRFTDLPSELVLEAGQPFSLTLHTTGHDVPSLQCRALPVGLTCAEGAEPGTWVVFGTVDREHAGVLTPQFALTNAEGQLARFVKVTVRAAPQWTPVVEPLEATTNVPFFSLSVTTVSGYPFDTSVEVVAGPAGLRPDVRTTSDTSGQVRLTGQFTTAGRHEVVLRYAGQDHTVVFDVQDAIVVDAPNELALVAGEHAAVTITARGGGGTPAFTILDDLPAGILARDNHDGTLTLSGTAVLSDTARTSVRILIESGSRSRTVAIAVFVVPRHQAARYDDATTDYAWQVPEVPAGATVTLVNGALPPGLSFDRDLVSLVGTATTPGHYEFTWRWAYGLQVGYVPVAFDHVAAGAFVDLPGSVTIVAGEPFELRLRTTGHDVPDLTVTNLPEGLSYARSDDTWVVSGTVARDLVGPRTITLTLSNAAGETTHDLPVTVTAAPVWTPTTHPLPATAGQAVTDVVVAGLSGYPLSGPVTVVSGPDGASARLRSTGTGSAEVLWTGTFLTPGTHTVRLRHDGVEHEVTFDVRSRLTIDLPADLTLVAGTAVDRPIRVLGTPVATSLTAAGLPDGLALRPDGAAVWRLTGTIEPTAQVYGTHHVTFVAGDGPTSSTRDVVVTVVGPPLVTARPDVDAVPAGSDVAASWAFALTGPTTVEVTGLPDGVAWHRDGSTVRVTGAFATPGRHDVTLVATNEHGTVRDTWRLLVTAPPRFDVPSSGPRPAVRGVAGQPLRLAFAVAGTPEPAVTAAGLPAGLRLVRAAAGAWEIAGTPTAAPGTYRVRITADNGSSAPVTFELAVTVDGPQPATDPADGGTGRPGGGRPGSAPAGAGGSAGGAGTTGTSGTASTPDGPTDATAPAGDGPTAGTADTPNGGTAPGAGTAPEDSAPEDSAPEDVVPEDVVPADGAAPEDVAEAGAGDSSGLPMGALVGIGALGLLVLAGGAFGAAVRRRG